MDLLLDFIHCYFCYSSASLPPVLVEREEDIKYQVRDKKSVNRLCVGKLYFLAELSIKPRSMI